MKLALYLSKNSITHAEFAARIGATQAAISRYASGKRIPRRALMSRITVVTDGNVTANDFVEALPAQGSAS